MIQSPCNHSLQLVFRLLVGTVWNWGETFKTLLDGEDTPRRKTPLSGLEGSGAGLGSGAGVSPAGKIGWRFLGTLTHQVSGRLAKVDSPGLDTCRT